MLYFFFNSLFPLTYLLQIKVPKVEETNCWMKSLFLFSFAHKMQSRSFEKLSLTPDVTWVILTMSLLRFWALIMVVPLLSMEGQKALRFHQNIFICVPKMTEGHGTGFWTTWGGVINFHFWVNYPFNLISKRLKLPLLHPVLQPFFVSPLHFYYLKALLKYFPKYLLNEPA